MRVVRRFSPGALYMAAGTQYQPEFRVLPTFYLMPRQS